MYNLGIRETSVLCGLRTVIAARSYLLFCFFPPRDLLV
jgi:hypothetical protein